MKKAHASVSPRPGWVALIRPRSPFGFRQPIRSTARATIRESPGPEWWRT